MFPSKIPAQTIVVGRSDCDAFLVTKLVRKATPNYLGKHRSIEIEFLPYAS